MPDRLRSVQLAWRAAFSEIGKASPAERFFTGQELAITNLKKRRFDCVSKSFGVCERVSEDHLSLYGGDAHRGIVMNVLPFLFIYQLIRPLLLGESLELGYAAWAWRHRRLRGPIRCPICKGPVLSHRAAYNTLKNLRASLQGKLERQPPGRDPGEGRGRLEEDVH